MLIHMSTCTVLKDFLKKITQQKMLKDGTNGDNGEKLNGHIINEEWTCINIWIEFKMNNMSDYNDHYLKKGVLLLAEVCW